MRSNLMKVHRTWARVSYMLWSENTSLVSVECSIATVQVVLLFGSETWNLSPSAMKCLDCFHLKAACYVTGMVPKRGVHSVWFYPLSNDTLEAAGLHTTKEYIDVRRQTIAPFIVNRPIFNLC